MLKRLLLFFDLLRELLNRKKSSFVDFSQLLNGNDSLLVNSRRSISRVRPRSSSSGRLCSLKFLHLFRKFLLCCAIWVIMIGDRRFV